MCTQFSTKTNTKHKNHHQQQHQHPVDLYLLLLTNNTFAPSEVLNNTLTTPTQYTLEQQQQQNKQKSTSTTKSHSYNEPPPPQPLIITTELLQFCQRVFGSPASSSSSQPIKFKTRPVHGSPHPPQDKACAGEIDNEGSVLSGLLYNWVGSIPSPYGEDGPTGPKQTISCLAVEFS